MGVNGKHTGSVFASRLIRTVCWSIIPGLFVNVLSNPGGGENFRTRPDRLRDPPSLLYKGCRLSFPWVKRPERRVNQLPHLVTRLNID
jgi:hypothetical protein